MEEKSQSQENRRKKILDNAEARLRFIREGIPWRNIETESSETQPDGVNLKNEEKPQPTLEDATLNMLSSESQTSVNADEKCHGVNQRTKQDVNRLNESPCRYNHVDPSSVVDSLGNSVSFIKEEVDSSNKFKTEKIENKCVPNKCLIQPNVTNEITSNTESVSKDDEVVTNGLEAETNENEEETINLDTANGAPDEIVQNDTNLNGNVDEDEIKDVPEAEVISEAKPARSTDLPGLIPDDLVRNIKALLSDSNNKREEQKRRTREMNVNIWTSLFIMLCLGTFTRICYSIGLSWLFRGVMWVPFISFAVPRLIPLLLNPPKPTGPLIQFLLMVGVRFKLLSQVFTVVSLLRTFLQLFSVFLIAFVFTHQVFETFSV